jgi:HK97 gp10 family phage protein
VIWFAAEEKRLLASTGGPVGQLIARLCVKVESAAKARCPVDTGRLRSSITWRVETDSDGVVGIVGTSVEYAIYVHEGTRHMAGRPFLVEGLRQVMG